MSKQPTFASFAATGQPITVDCLDQVLAFHRNVFGSTRMEDPPAGADGAPAGEQGAAGATGAEGADGAAGRGPGTDGDKPISQMNDAEKAVYFEKKATRYKTTLKDREDYDAVKAERDRLRAATQTDAEKAVEAARAEEREKVTREVATTYQTRLVQAEIKAALAGKNVPADQVKGHVDFIDPTKFLTDTGEVNTELVTQYAAGIAPGQTWPDLGNGRRGTSGTSKGVAAGAEMFSAGKKTTSTS